LDRKRIEYPGAFYHVVQRGNNRDNIFLKDADKQRYLSNLIGLRKVYDFNLLGFALMDNHYHLLLQTGEDPLSKVIYRQNMLYSRYFNRTHNRSGHIYGARYKASLVLDESYLFAVLRYIHWNPLKAGLCSDPKDYPWSSDACYRQNRSDIVDIDYILKILNPNRENSIRDYIRMMKVEDGVQFESFKIIGDETFNDSINKSSREEKELHSDLDQILKSTGVSDIDFELIKAGSRKRYLALYKTAYINEAVAQGYSYREIGSNINISDSAVGLYR
jgi:putative transposase